MDKELTLVFCIMSLMAAAAFAPAVLAQDNTDIVVNNTTLNNTTVNNISEDNSGLSNAGLDNTTLNQTALNETALNLSTAEDTTSSVAPISDMANVDPVLAATASSAQVASDPEGVFKLGEGVGGRDLFEVKENGVKTMEIGIPIKPLRDVGKMVFVCDIV